MFFPGVKIGKTIHIQFFEWFWGNIKNWGFLETHFSETPDFENELKPFSRRFFLRAEKNESTVFLATETLNVADAISNKK